MNIEIKQCTIQDVNLLREVSIETFIDTYKDQNTDENMKLHLSKAFSLNQLEIEISCKNTEFYFIFMNDKIAGYLKINYNDAQTKDIGPECLEIERIYIKKIYQGKGLGKYLIEHSQEILLQLNMKKIWLVVWERNEKAIQFYSKKGFIQSGFHSFYLGDEIQKDIIMLKVVEGKI
ncbi:GNAT family N-acetyltransferase [Alkalihalobacillus sp. NPDC078783]